MCPAQKTEIKKLHIIIKNSRKDTLESVETVKINTSRTLIKHAKLLMHLLQHYKYKCPQLKRESNR